MEVFCEILFLMETEVWSSIEMWMSFVVTWCERFDKDAVLSKKLLRYSLDNDGQQ